MSAPSASAHLIVSARDTALHGGISPDPVLEIRPGSFVLRSEWEAMFSEARLRTRGLAVARRRRGEEGAVAFAAAAAFHLLPLYRVRSDKVSIIEPTTHPRRNAGDIIRHQMPLAEADVVVIDGVRVTSLDRTVYDVIRMVSLEAAICVFDAALRQCAWDGGTTYTRRRNTRYPRRLSGTFEIWRSLCRSACSAPPRRPASPGPRPR